MPLIGGALPLIGSALPLIEGAVPLIGGGVPLIGGAVPLIVWKDGNRRKISVLETSLRSQILGPDPPKRNATISIVRSLKDGANNAIIKGFTLPNHGV